MGRKPETGMSNKMAAMHVFKFFFTQYVRALIACLAFIFLIQKLQFVGYGGFFRERAILFATVSAYGCLQLSRALVRENANLAARLASIAALSAIQITTPFPMLYFLQRYFFHQAYVFGTRVAVELSCYVLLQAIGATLIYRVCLSTARCKK